MMPIKQPYRMLIMNAWGDMSREEDPSTKRAVLWGLMASDPSGVVGFQNHLPWFYADEIQHFRDTLAGQTAIMGRVTFEHTEAKILSTCHNLVLSRAADPKYFTSTDIQHITFIKTIEDCINHSYLRTSRTNYVIGGASIMNQFLVENLVDGFILTILHKSYEGEARININLLKNWGKIEIKNTPDYGIYKMLNPTSPHYEILKT